MDECLTLFCNFSEIKGAIDCRLIDLANLICIELPKMKLIDVISMVRDQQTWKSYVVVSESDKIIGGCIVREHQDQQAMLAELALMAIDQEC